MPRYIPDAPRTGGTTSLDPFFPPNALTLASTAMSEEAAHAVMTVLDKLTPSNEIAAQQLFYRWGETKFGRHWRFADMTTVLWAAATLVQPDSYLEIGVHRGRSSAVVANTRPTCAIYGFDLWIEGYGGMDNPGPEFVQGELRAVGHRGSLELASGNSHKTVPAFLREHPDLYFDLITVDGDHSFLGGAIDIANVLPRLKIGGIVVFDDITVAPALLVVWERLVKQDDRYASWEFTDDAYGVAAAIRTDD